MDQSLLTSTGAPPNKPTKYIPLGTKRFFTGLYTSRNPLIEPGTRAESRFYGGRPDALWDGGNVELGADGMLIRRPGHSLFSTLNSAPQSVYTFRAPLQPIKTMTDTLPVSAPLVNTAFVGGSSTGWSLQSGWTVSPGVGPTGQAYLANFNGSGTGAITNNAQVPCKPGDMVVVSAQILGHPGSVGNTFTIINFYTASGTLLNIVASAAVPANFTWVNATVQVTAPATAAYYIAQAAVESAGSSDWWSLYGMVAYTAGQVYQVAAGTTPTAIFTKSAGAGRAYYQAVGSQLFFSDGVDLMKWDGTHLWNWGIAPPVNAPTLAISGGAAPASPPTLTVGTTGTTILYVRTSFLTPFGETQASQEAFIGVSSAYGLVVSAPSSPPTNATGWNCYIGTVAGGETLQNSSPISLSVNFTLTGAPTTTGAVPPGSSNGSYNITSTLGVSYAYCFQNAYTAHVSTASPVSAYTGPQASVQVTVSGTGSSDPQVSNIQIYRTTDGGATYLLLATIANPGTGSWTYVDTGTPDADLNEDIIAPQALANNPPPAGLQNLAYFYGCIYGSVGSYLYFSNGALTTNGSGNESWPPLNYALLPSQITRLVPYPSGLFIFTVDDLYVVTAPGATPTLYQSGMGVLNYNAVAMNGGTIYAFTSDRSLISLTPGGVVNDLGFGIAGQFASWDPSSTSVAYHIYGHADNALFMCDGLGHIFRCNPNQQPEGGPAWSTMATVAAGAANLVSAETSFGVHQLLVCSGTNILYRDWTVNTDVGVAYDAWVVIGSLVLALPGQLCEVESITVEAARVGTLPGVSVLLGEISGTFESLPVCVNDPFQLPESQTLFSKRFYLLQAGKATVCRHMQIRLDFGNDTVQNQLLSFSLYGALHVE